MAGDDDLDVAAASDDAEAVLELGGKMRESGPWEIREASSGVGEMREAWVEVSAVVLLIFTGLSAFSNSSSVLIRSFFCASVSES